VKAHRGEPANEEADIQADKAISSKDIPTEWHDRTKRAVFIWQEPRRMKIAFIMMMIAFITFKGSLVPLLEGL